MWTEEEKKYLKENYRKNPGKEVLESTLGRNIKAIQMEAIRLGLHADQRYCDWTEREDAILRENYPNIDIYQLLELLPGRTRESVNYRSRKLGLKHYKYVVYEYKTKKEMEWTEEEDRAIFLFYECGGIDRLEKFLINRSRQAIMNRAKSLGFETSHNWSNHELSILLKYYPVEGIAVSHRLPRIRTSLITSKVKSLHLKYEAPSARPWSKEEISILKANYRYGIAVIKKLLPDRTTSDIKDMSDKINLFETNGKKFVLTKKRLEIIKQFYPLEGMDVIYRIPGSTAADIKAALNILEAN